MTGTGNVEQLDRSECLRLLAADCVGRLVTVVGGAPQVFPVNYQLDGECVVIRTDAGAKLDGAERAPACFEIDNLDRDARSGWSVVVHGRLEEVTRCDGLRFRHTSSLPITPWVAGEKLHWLRVVPSYFTGRRIARALPIT